MNAGSLHVPTGSNTMSDQDENNDKLDITDADAEQLLADDVDESSDAAEKPREAEKDSRNWQSEAERWKSLSRKHENAAKQNAAKLKKYEDEGKSESQRLQEDRDSHKSRAEKAEAALRRREIAEGLAPEHATVAQIRAVAKRLHGDDDDALEADAKELFELIAPEPPEPAKPKTTTRPKERLRGGGAPDEDDPDDTDDPRKLADLIRGTKS